VVFLNLEQRYAAVLKQAESFLSSAKKTVSGSNLSNTHLLLLLKHKADCPLCGVVFEGENHNSEHIHPRALGGTNEAKNKIQLCKNCNNCKNSVMQRHVAMPPPYHKGYPDNWEAVKAFLLWSELTIDDGLMAGVAIPEVHKIFLEERFAGEQPRQGPKRAFGRASTLDKAQGPNYPHNVKIVNSQHNERPKLEGKKKAGFWTTFAVPILDRVFGFGDEVQATLVDSKQNTKQNTANTNMNDRDSDDFSILEDRTIEDFIKFIESILTTEPQSLTVIGKIIEKWLKDLKSENTTTSHFLALHGLPRGLKKAIETHLGDRIQISGDSPKFFVALKSTTQGTTQSKKQDPQKKLQPTSTKYPEVEPGFQTHILKALQDVEGEFKLSTLSTMLEDYLDSVGLAPMSFKQFAKSHGIPARRTAVEILDHYFSDTLAYRRQETMVFVCRIDHEEE
jgi:hypothetical protein